MLIKFEEKLFRLELKFQNLCWIRFVWAWFDSLQLFHTFKIPMHEHYIKKIKSKIEKIEIN